MLYAAYYLPCHPEENRIATFLPDFVFWLAKGKDYHIVFVDPKGMAHTKTYWKLDGYRRLFEKDGQPVRIKHDGIAASVHAFCYNATLRSPTSCTVASGSAASPNYSRRSAPRVESAGAESSRQQPDKTKQLPLDPDAYVEPLY